MKLLFTSLCFLLHVAAFCQGEQILKEGDTLANYEVKMVEDGKIVSTRDLISGRKLILYFWGRRCLPCVKGLPKLDSIQSKFGNKLLVLCVSPEKDIKEVQDFLSARPALSQLRLTFVTDSSLAIYRGFLTSNVCWFDEKGILRVITKSENTNQNNIGKWLNGKAISFKKEIQVPGAL